MTPEKLFHQMLGLGTDWEVLACQFLEEEKRVCLEIGETSSLAAKARCPKCRGAIRTHDHTEVLEWRHLNIFEHRCDIRCRLPRFQCKDCKHTHRVTPPWEGLARHFTQSFEAYVLMLAREMPVARVALLVGETDTRLWRLLSEQVKAARAQADFSNVTCVGVDEMNVRKGQKYLSVFADLLERRVLFGTPGRDASVWAKFVEDLGAHNGHPHAILEASMDMSKPYQKGVADYCRHAHIVFDKFHVVANVSAAVDQTRKAESSGRGGTAPEALRKTLWLWRKNPENLTEQEKARLEALDGEHLWTAKAYQLRLSLQKIYQENSAELARQRFTDWCQLVEQIGQAAPRVVWAAMVGAAKMIRTHLEGILAHWRNRITNAFMEGLNSVFSATKRKARGYRSTEYLLTILYLVAGKLKLPITSH